MRSRTLAVAYAGGRSMRNAMTVGEIRVGTFAWAEVLAAGALAGAAGGMLFALAAVAHAALSGTGVFFPARLVGATMVGPAALVLGPEASLYGLGLHMLVSIAFGVMFAMIVDRSTRVGPALLGGMAVGIAALAVMTFLVVPHVNPTLHARIPLVPGAWFFGHVLFGLGLATAPWLRRRMSRAREV